MRYFRILALCALVPSQDAHAGWLGKITGNVGKSIEKSAQDVGKAIERGAHDVGRPVENPGRPESEQSPSDPCRNNPQLPQCEALEGIGRTR